MKYVFNILTSLSVRFRAVTFMLVLVLMVTGGIAATRMNQELIPPIAFPQTFILAQAPGMTSEQVLTVVTERIEPELDAIDDIINLESTTTGAFGAVITAYNDFGLDQDRLRNDIRDAIDNVWFPQRRIVVPEGEDPTEFAQSLLSDLNPETLIYIAQIEPNFLFQLSTDVWQSLSVETIEALVVYLSSNVVTNTVDSTALEQFVQQELIPQLETVDAVANVSFEGGQALPGETGALAQEVTATESESLLLRLAPEVWATIAEKINAPAELNDSAVAQYAVDNYMLPAEVPALPESWRVDHFSTAQDLIEIESLANSISEIFNDFYTNGRIVGSLGTTDDLTPDIINQMLEIEPSMVQYFEADHLVAMSDEAFAALPQEFIANLDGFTRDELAAAALARSLSNEDVQREPVELPDPWRIPPPQLITFSSADFPLVVFSIAATGEVELSVPADATDNSATGDEEANVSSVRAVPEGFVAMGEMLGVEVQDASDLLAVEVPPAFAPLVGAEVLSPAQLLNFIADPPPLAAAAAGGNSGDGGVLIGELSPEAVQYFIDNDETFLTTLEPALYTLFNDDVLALDAVSQASESVAANQTTTGEAPALPEAFVSLGAQLGLELQTVDDIVEIQVPAPFATFIGSSSLKIGELLNFVVAPPPAIAAMAGNQEGDPADLVTALDAEIVAYILSKDPAAFDGLLPEVVDLMSEDVVALLPGSAFGLPDQPLGDAWNVLASQPQFADQPLIMASDLVSIGNGSPSSVLDTINTNIPAEFEGYEVRLFDSLTPETIAYLAQAEDDFYSKLDSSIVVKFSPAVLATLPEDYIAGLDEDIANTINAIASGDQPSAFSMLQSEYSTDVAPADPDAPALNPAWQEVGNFQGIELDTADDFFRFPEGFSTPDAASYMNSIMTNPGGSNFARNNNLFGDLPLDAVEYLLERDQAVFDALSAEVLRLMSDDAIALMPSAVQQRAANGGNVFEPDRQVTRTNQSPSLNVTVLKDVDANTVTTYADVEKIIDQVEEENPNLSIDVIFEQSSFVEESISGVAREGGLGAVFAIIIILIFLSSGVWAMGGRRITGAVMFVVFGAGLVALVASGLDAAGNDWSEAFSQADTVFRVLLIGGVLSGLVILFVPAPLPYPAWRATIVIGVSIPLSIMIAFVLMYWLSPAMYRLIQPLSENSAFFEFLLRLFPEELTLNILTLSGLTVAVGRVVDDSIVVLENIFRQIQSTNDKREAVLSGTRDVSAAIFVATMVAVVVFLPLGLTGGLIGAFFLPFGLAVTYALAGSFIVAVTVVPALAYITIDPTQAPEEGDMWLAAYYKPVLKWSLASGRNKAIVLLIAFVSFIFSGFLFGQRPFAFLPNFGEPQITVSVNLPSSTKILETNEKVGELEQFVADTVPEENLSVIQTVVGGGGQSFEALFAGGGVSENQATLIIGLDVAEGELDPWTQSIREAANNIFGEENVTVSSASVAEGGFGGFSLIVAGPVEELEQLDPIIIETLNGVEGITNVSSNFSEAAADGEGPITYIRVNQETAISYTAELETENTIGVTQLAIEAIQDLPDLPDSVRVSQGFSSETQTEGFTTIILVALPLAFLIVVVILIVSLGSPVYWLAIVMSVFVAPVGASVALTLADRVLGISALIGILMLLGLVITNAVVLIDRVQSNLVERDMELYDALVEAGGRRLRPILMTSLATIIALIPLAVGLSQGAIIAEELGTVVIGGVFSSTLLTLIVVPVLYSLLRPIHQFLYGLVGIEAKK